MEPGARKIFGAPQSDDVCRGVQGDFPPETVFNLGSLKWHFLNFESTFHKSLFCNCSVSIIFKKILLIIAPLIKRGSLLIIIVYCIVATRAVF